MSGFDKRSTKTFGNLSRTTHTEVSAISSLSMSKGSLRYNLVNLTLVSILYRKLSVIMNDIPNWFYSQSAVIPFKIINSELSVLLITSRNKKRWIIPKGIIEENLSAKQSAVKEALEEAGVEGKIYKESIGKYDYKKWGGVCHVEVFLLLVEKEYDIWDEMDIRQRKWFTARKAAKKVKEEKLSMLINKLIKYVKSNSEFGNDIT